MDARDEEAHRAILSHHAKLVAGVRSRVAALSAAVAARQPYQAARAELVAFLTEDVLTHAVAEEASLYPAAARTGLAGRIEAMEAEHRQLAKAIDDLALATDPAGTVAGADAIEELFVSHVTAENDEVLPALMGDEGVSLALLLARIKECYAAATVPLEESAGVAGAEVPLASVSDG